MLAVGIDIGGTKIAGGLVDENGNILDYCVRKTTANNIEHINSDIANIANNLSKNKQIAGVGVATTGLISKNRDVILFGTNTAHKSYNFKQALEKMIPHRVVIENDANAAGWAEYKFGQGKGYNSMLMITSGTGVGGAIVFDNNLIRGDFGKGGEIGHMKIVPNGLYCSCGMQGCWEAYASGTALIHSAYNLLKYNPNKMQNILSYCNKNRIVGPAITSAAKNGDETAKQLLAELGWWIGYGASNLATIIDPEIIVIGGGVSAAGDLVLEHIKKGYYDNLTGSSYVDTANIVLATAQNNAGMVGAADFARI